MVKHRLKLFVAALAIAAAAISPAWGQTTNYTLSGIPTGWTVTADGQAVTVTDNVATIPAGTAVKVTPPDAVKNKVKSVTLKDDPLLDGQFSVSANKKVQFSQGNLQAVCTFADDKDDTQETFTWQFAEHQWSYVGNAAANTSINGNGSVSSPGTVDLFGWVGASSTWTGAAQYGISNSYNTGNTDGYGNVVDEGLSSDWGATMGTGWRTLTIDEWEYLFSTRTNAAQKYGHGRVNSVYGMIILPDTWTLPDGLSFTAGKSAWTNSYNSEQWALMEAAGAVFLPAAGSREGSMVSFADDEAYNYGKYWSSSHYSNSEWAYGVIFSTNEPVMKDNNPRKLGFSVRLVKDAE